MYVVEKVIMLRSAG